MEFFEEGANLRARIERSSEKDLRLAAEAVVDAAIWRQKLRPDICGGAEITEATRSALVEAVYNDPAMTGYLFQDEAWERH